VSTSRNGWCNATGGKGNAGVVSFEPLGESQTRVTVQLDWQPEGVLENVGTALGMDDRQVAKDLARFKELSRAEAKSPVPGEARSDRTNRHAAIS
jgi:uncharacterized membrane protein